MKQFLIAAALLLPGALPAQAQAQAPAVGAATAHTGDNTIVVQLPAGTGNAWQYVGLVLFEHQLAIRASDQALGTLLTDEYSDGATSYLLTVAALVRDQTVVLHATTRSRFREVPAAVAVRLHTSTEKEWRQLDALAHALGGTVTYRAE